MDRESPLPKDLTHYYKAPHPPMRSITELNPAEAERVIVGLSAANTIAVERFRSPAYLPQRRRAEARLRTKFVALGGQPIRSCPLYFVLGRSVSFFEKHEQLDLRWASIDLDALPEQCVSFTYGDSAVNDLIARGEWFGDEPSRQPWHGEVYRRHQLQALVERIGLPPEWRPGRDHYIEAQLWMDPPSELVRLGAATAPLNTHDLNNYRHSNR
jgi:hypothetical protein